MGKRKERGEGGVMLSVHREKTKVCVCVFFFLNPFVGV